MEEFNIIQGDSFSDHRGTISFVNEFNFTEVARSYVIYQPDVNVVRGWNGHQFEKKWFCCIKGVFKIGIVKPDDWQTPSKDLEVSYFILKDNEFGILSVPEGFANCIKAIQTDSILIVYSGKDLKNAEYGSWKYDPFTWGDWL